MIRTTVMIPESTDEAISAISRESYKRDDVPDLSQSEAIRHLLTQALDRSDLLDLIPEHELIAHRRANIERKNNLTDWREGIETRIKRQTGRRFKNGYDPDQIEAFLIGYREEAHVLWWDEDNPEHVARRREVLDFIDAVIRRVREIDEVSDYDPLDPETMFSGFSGVKEGDRKKAREQTIEAIELQREIREHVDGLDPESKRTIDRVSVTTLFANKHGLDQELVRSVVDEVFDTEVIA